MRLYLDMDGVLADFDRAMANLGVKNENHFIHLPVDQWTPEQKDLDRRVREHMETAEFWRTMPVMQDAFRLWSACEKFSPYILTATPRETNIRTTIDYQKRCWIQAVFGPYPDSRIIVCLRSEKKRYATGGFRYDFGVEQNVLIDDMAANCAEWRKTGGFAIEHTDAESSIAKLTSYTND